MYIHMYHLAVFKHHLAATMSQGEWVQELLKHGADVKANNRHVPYRQHLGMMINYDHKSYTFDVRSML